MIYTMRNPHTGKVRMRKEMDSSNARITNEILKKNGKRYRWQYRSRGKWMTPMPRPEPNYDTWSYRLIRIL